MSAPDRIISISQPKTLVFGVGCAAQVAADLVGHGVRRVFIVTSTPTRGFCETLLADLKKSEVTGAIWDQVNAEPTIKSFEDCLAAAKETNADAVVGLGGGSAMDVAKLVAAFLGSTQPLRETFGIGKLSGRSKYLICIPTTAGTGSEVSPNAILLDETEELKKGVISPFLMPDAAYVDPLLTLSVPPAVTAATGMDALTHCIEAYVNRLAHPLIDLYAMQGIRLISQNLEKAVTDGKDVAARSQLLLGSMYGGICLGPVNTGAVHALAYPLGGEFHVAHGVSNALLLPHVLKFNLPAAPKRYAEVAIAMGVPSAGSDEATALAGLKRISELSKACGIPAHLKDFGIPESAIERMAKAAMTVTRLLERNVREVKLEDAIEIYRSAF